MISIFALVFAAFAAVLSVLSLKTLRSIKHLEVGKSFWMPMFASGVIFLAGSVVEILNGLDFWSLPMVNEIVQISRIIALCTLIVGVYSYSSQITKNLAENFTAPPRFAKATLEVEEADSDETPPIQERLDQEPPRAASAQGCQYQLGYLRTLAKDAPIPDECLSCDKIIECRHSLVKAPESPATETS